MYVFHFIVTIRNVADITSFAGNYHAEQLKNACMQFVCLNLAPLLEGRYVREHSICVWYLKQYVNIHI